MTEPRKSSNALIYTGLTLAAFCVPCSIPLAVTLVAWCFGVSMRLSLPGSLFVTFAMFAAWFVFSEIGDLLLRRLALGNRMAEKLVSNLPSLVVLALGYWLIFESIVAAAVAATIVIILFYCLSPVIDYWYNKAAPDSGGG